MNRSIGPNILSKLLYVVWKVNEGTLEGEGYLFWGGFL